MKDGQEEELNDNASCAPQIVAAAHVAPVHDVSQEFIRAIVAREFAGRIPDLDKLLAVFDHSRIACRQFVRPPDWYRRPHTWAERNRIFHEAGLELADRAIRLCLERARCSAEDVDHLVFVTSTGFATPTLDAFLINRLGFRPGISRLPIWGLGCAAGAVGIARSAEFCRAHPRARVLLVAVELCSLAFMTGDLSKKNVVATSLFADGAAALLLAGAEAGMNGPRILDSMSHLFPDTYRIMGWDFLDEGMSLVLSPRLPALIRQNLAPLVDSFLARHELPRSDIRYYFTHPGGARVIDVYREALGLTEEELRLSETVLNRHGNMSSVTVLAVLDKWFAESPDHPSGAALLSAFGPGFSAELLLLAV